jgi:hypothetical protein
MRGSRPSAAIGFVVVSVFALTLGMWLSRTSVVSFTDGRRD